MRTVPRRASHACGVHCMSTKMMSKIFIFFRTSHFATYISTYIRWPVPGVPYLIDVFKDHLSNKLKIG